MYVPYTTILLLLLLLLFSQYTTTTTAIGMPRGFDSGSNLTGGPGGAPGTTGMQPGGVPGAQQTGTLLH